MFETVKEVDEDTVTKKSNVFLTRDNTASILSGNVDHSYEINN